MKAALFGKVCVQSQGTEIGDSYTSNDPHPERAVPSQVTLKKRQSEPNSTGEAEAEHADQFSVKDPDVGRQESESLELRQEIPLRTDTSRRLRRRGPP